MFTCLAALTAAVLLGSGCAGVPRTLTPIAGAPEFSKLDWRGSDEFCRREIRDGRSFFIVDVPAGRAPGEHWFSAKFDPAPFRGKTVTLLIRYRTKGITAPPKAYLGSKFMFSYHNGPGNEKYWPDAGLPEGTNDWSIGAIIETVPLNATDAEIMLGMQDVSGYIEFDFDTLEVGTVFSPDDRINLDYKVKYPDEIKNHRRQRGVMSPGGPITEEMLQTLHSWNANLIRAQIVRNWGQIGTETDLVEYNQWLDNRLDQIEAAAKLAPKYGIKFVIDLHSPPGGKVSSRNMRMFFEKKYADAFIDCWRKIATRFKDNPAIYAYDLVNEPVQAMPAPYDYWNLQRMAAEAIREIDPDTPIMIESNESDRPQTFVYLSPLRMDNIIYKVHMYFPLTYTHQRLQGEGPSLTYPGMIEGEMWNKEKIRQTLQPVRDFQLRHDAKIYVGEFSAIVWAPGAERYIKDCIDIFEEYGWDWTFHAFREWAGWSPEHDGTGPDDLKPAPNTKRKQALLEGFKNNVRE